MLLVILSNALPANVPAAVLAAAAAVAPAAAPAQPVGSASAFVNALGSKHAAVIVATPAASAFDTPHVLEDWPLLLLLFLALLLGTWDTAAAPHHAGVT
jgi:hypothetical protein